MKIEDREQFLQTKVEIEIIKKKISLYLDKQDRESFEKICALMEEKQSIEFAAEDRELYVLQIMTNVQRQEMIEGEHRCLFEGRDLKQVIELYQRLVFYLRRLEFGLSIEEQKELIDYMLREQLSAVCILGVIHAAKYIYAKEKTLQAFMTLLEMM